MLTDRRLSELDSVPLLLLLSEATYIWVKITQMNSLWIGVAGWLKSAFKCHNTIDIELKMNTTLWILILSRVFFSFRVVRLSNVFMVFTPVSFLLLSFTHTHTHTHTLFVVYVCLCCYKPCFHPASCQNTVKSQTQRMDKIDKIASNVRTNNNKTIPHNQN